MTEPARVRVLAGDRLARFWFGATALTVLAGLVIQILVTAHATTGHFHTPIGRVLNLFAFFTIDLNMIVGVTCLLLAGRLSRRVHGGQDDRAGGHHDHRDRLPRGPARPV